MKRLALLSLLLSCGCARNAFLELEIDLPANVYKSKTGDRFANIRVVSGDVPFEQDWQVDAPLASPLIDPNNPSVQRISIESTKDSEERPVRVKVRFCKNASCTALGDDGAPELRLHLERAFYIGQRTSYRWSIACIPNVPVETDDPKCDTAQRTIKSVSKCEVGGCRSGTSSNFCTGGKHFCEP